MSSQPTNRGRGAQQKARGGAQRAPENLSGPRQPGPQQSSMPSSQSAWGQPRPTVQQSQSQPQPRLQQPQQQPQMPQQQPQMPQQQTKPTSAWGKKPVVPQTQHQQPQPQQQQQPLKQQQQQPQPKQQQQTPKQQQPQQQQQSRRAAGSPQKMFPNKPVRTGAAPGIRVQLISNLFAISLETKRPIYIYGVNVDEILFEDSGDRKASGPRKIPKDIRIPAVREAIDLWTKNNSIDKSLQALAYKYVLDSNGSMVISLFNMLSESDAMKKSLDVEVEIPCERTKDRKLVKVDRRFSVKFSGGSQLSFQDLVDFCAGNTSKDYTSLLEHIRAVNVIMQSKIIHIPRLFSAQSKSGVGSIFSLDRKENLSPGVFCSKGTTLSVRATERGLVLNIANTVGAFYYPKKLTDFITERYRVDLSKGMNQFQQEALLKDLRNKQVEVLHINYGTKNAPHYKKYRIKDVSGNGKSKFTSKDAQGKEFTTTVEEYFAKEYPAFKLRYPQLPCVVDNGRQLPLEVCQIVDKQRVVRKLDPQETSNIIKIAALKPESHFEDVRQNAHNVSQNVQPLNDFGLKLHNTPIEVEGRELPPVEILCGGKKCVMTRGGEYNIQREKFAAPTTVNKWSLCFLIDDFVSRSSSRFQAYFDMFNKSYCDAGRSKGVTISPTSSQLVRYIPASNQQTLNRMDDRQIKAELLRYFTDLNDMKVDFAVILLPDRPDWLYSYIQYVEILPDVRKTRKAGEKCTRSSCIKFSNFDRKIVNDRQGGIMFLSNLWLKHNVKLGGVNVVLKPDQNFGITGQRLNFLAEGFLYVSIDVCHPAPGDKFMQSVAAMVGMWDLTNPNISHTTRLRVQAKHKSKTDLATVEEVGEIRIMFDEILATYVKKKGKPPTHVVVLRDGVSEGQFKMVLQSELSKIMAGLKSKAPSAKLTCFTVQKRHKVRFMRKVPVVTRRGDNDYNIQPGTVVDSVVTHPTDHTFYLAPHKAIQGTSRAPYIYMIYDDIGFDRDSPQAMIHALSYLSPRCTKGTSIPTPINLADLAAERGKNIVISWSSTVQNPRGMEQQELLAILNGRLSDLGDANYRNTLFYV